MNSDELLKQKFISRILLEESGDIKTAQTKEMTSKGFQSRKLLSDRHFSVNGNTMTYEHDMIHRFVDMSTRTTGAGKRRKIAHPIHNKILFGHANNVVRRLSFEYTSRMKEMLKNEHSS